MLLFKNLRLYRYSHDFYAIEQNIDEGIFSWICLKVTKRYVYLHRYYLSEKQIKKIKSKPYRDVSLNVYKNFATINEGSNVVFYIDKSTSEYKIKDFYKVFLRTNVYYLPFLFYGSTEKLSIIKNSIGSLYDVYISYFHLKKSFFMYLSPITFEDIVFDDFSFSYNKKDKFYDKNTTLELTEENIKRILNFYETQNVIKKMQILKKEV